MKGLAVLSETGQRPLTKEEEAEFIRHLTKALLLALLERGRLTDQQYRRAARQAGIHD